MGRISSPFTSGLLRDTINLNTSVSSLFLLTLSPMLPFFNSSVFRICLQCHSGLLLITSGFIDVLSISSWGDASTHLWLTLPPQLKVVPNYECTVLLSLPWFLRHWFFGMNPCQMLKSTAFLCLCVHVRVCTFYAYAYIVYMFIIMLVCLYSFIYIYYIYISIYVYVSISSSK